MKIKSLLLALSLLSTMHFAVAKEKNYPVEAYNSVVLTFAKGDFRLSREESEKLKAFSNSVKSKGEPAKIEVAAWSDEEHQEGVNLSKPFRDLARMRILAVTDQLNKEFGNLKYIGTYNMAESVQGLGRYYHSSEAELEAVFAKKETGTLEPQDFDLMRKDGAPSKAVVIFKINLK